ncbi:Phage Terminase [Roseovarius litorisediminis]|uniref:Phage Terminase n=1 Tax=Roseovarius litorisediminis TaxID=1312363 RepID=A0A1Y5TER6_9RHOB|nr:terminase TerL endonuclease subunit [Roseovarius litorisediminis]SLN62236.1 Phage Terminase [Roseovarius litorisediminis]
MTNASAYPDWIYDDSPIPDPMGYGERAVQFLRRLRHPNSDAPRRAFQLAPFQERIVRRIYGPRHTNGRRIVQNVFLLVPRGNRKTSLAAALALLHTIGPEHVPAGQVIFAAADREQAGIGFREAANVIREDKRLIAATRIYDAFNSAKQIVFNPAKVTLRAISSDGGAAHGLTPTFTLIDEIHIWKGRDLWEALRSGAAKVDDSLTVIATTAGRGAETLAAEQYEYARRVALGEISNPAYLPILFAADSDEDWQDEDVWHRVNPGLPHGFPSLQGMRALAKEAEHRPADRHAFLQFNLNVWQANSRDPLFDMATYDHRTFDLNLAEMEGLPCYLGVDMSISGDLTAIVAAWRHDDGQITIYPWFFVPGEDLKGRSDRDGLPYEVWRDEGLINVIPGPIIDPTMVEDTIRELCATYDVEEIAFDPHLARATMQRLYDDGLPTVEFRQTPLNMGVAAGDLERTVNGELIRHSGHAALRQHFDSVVASRNQTTGLTRMHKSKKTDRIDGAIASAMAVSRACAGETNKSQYSGVFAEIFTF